MSQRLTQAGGLWGFYWPQYGNSSSHLFLPTHTHTHQNKLDFDIALKNTERTSSNDEIKRLCSNSVSPWPDEKLFLSAWKHISYERIQKVRITSSDQGLCVIVHNQYVASQPLPLRVWIRVNICTFGLEDRRFFRVPVIKKTPTGKYTSLNHAHNNNSFYLFREWFSTENTCSFPPL